MELLVVVVIIGVLAAIAVPNFISRQGKAYEARIVNDARQAANAEEAYFVDHGTYYEGADCTEMPGMSVSAGTSCSATATPGGFEIETSHPRAARSCRWSTSTSPNLVCS